MNLFKLFLLTVTFLSNVCNGESSIEELEAKLEKVIHRLDILKSLNKKKVIPESVPNRRPDSGNINPPFKFQKNLPPKSVSELETSEIKGPKNSLSYYYGFCVPFDSQFRQYDLAFKTGHYFKVEYKRKFKEFFLGGSVSSKFFNNRKLKTGIIGVGDMAAKGQHSVFSTDLAVGWKPHINRLLFLEKKLSMGVAFSNNNLTLMNSSTSEFNSGIHYSISLGLGFQFSDHFHSMVSYNFDGNANSGRFGHQNFNQVELSTGVNF